MKLSDWILGYNKLTTHGASDFAGFREKRKLLSPHNTGVYIGPSKRLSPQNSNAHILLEAPTSSGKTTAYILNQALGIWPDNVSLVFFDPSSEISELSEAWLVSQGFKVIKIDLTNPTHSAQHNSLDIVTSRSAARRIAHTIISIIYNKVEGDQFWSESGISVLTLFILAVTHKSVPQSQRTLSYVLVLLNKMGHAETEVDLLMQTTLSDEDFSEYASFKSAPDKLKHSVISTIKSSLYLFSEDLLKHITARSTFSFSELREKKTVLFLSQEEHLIPLYKPFWSNFFRQLFSYLMENDGNQCYLFCDELPHYGAIPEFDTLISTLRSRKVSISIIVQSYNQLISNYSDAKAATIFENCGSKLYLPGLSSRSAQTVSNLLGRKTETFSPKGIFEKDQPRHRVGRPLLHPDEIRTMKKGEALLIHGNLKPMKVHFPGYYESRVLRKRAKL